MRQFGLRIAAAALWQIPFMLMTGWTVINYQWWIMAVGVLMAHYVWVAAFASKEA